MILSPLLVLASDMQKQHALTFQGALAHAELEQSPLHRRSVDVLLVGGTRVGLKRVGYTKAWR